MKRILFLLIFNALAFFAVTSPTEANGSFWVTGSVTDTEGKPLSGAVVVVENTMLGATTGLEGMYRINIKRAGEYSLTASYIGYKSQTVVLQLDADANINFVLSMESIMAEAVIVSATRANSRMPIAQTNIDAQKLSELKTGFDIPYLLELVPSVVAVSEGGTGVGNTSFRIRGTDMTRINVTVNGIPLNDPESQGVFWVNMPDFANSVNTVQVQRGVGTSTQGAGAFGATVNFQTKTLNPEPFVSGDATVGSFGTYRSSVSAGTGLINDRFSFESRYSRVKSDGYIDRGWSDHQSIFFTGAHHTEKSILRFNLIHGVQHTGITWEGLPSEMLETNRRYNPAGFIGVDEVGNSLFYPNESDNYTQTHYQLLYGYQFSDFFSLNITNYWTAGKGYYEQYKANRKLIDYGIAPIIVGDDTTRRTDLVRQKWLDNNLLGGTFSLNYSKNNLNAVLGGGLNIFTNSHFGNIIWTKVNANIPKDYQWYLNDAQKTDFNIFLKSSYQIIENLSLFGDLQFRKITYDLKGNDDDLILLDQYHSWDFFNPKAGFFYQLSPNQDAFFSVGVAHREPSRADIKDALKGMEKNTPREESLVDYEMGYSHNSQRFALKTNLFYMDYKDQLVLTGKLSDVGYPLMTNVKKSYRAGIELMSSMMPLPWFRWDANLTFSQNRIIDYVEYVDLYDNPNDWNTIEGQPQIERELGDVDISFSPSVIGSSQIRIEPIQRLGISIITKYVGKQHIDNSNSPGRMLDAYKVSNIKVDYKLNLNGTKGVSFQLIVNNFFNKQYVSNGYIWYRAAFNDGSPDYQELRLFPQAGINFMAKLLVEF
jgi:iron complex outermembrane receptor protein